MGCTRWRGTKSFSLSRNRSQFCLKSLLERFNNNTFLQSQYQNDFSLLSLVLLCIDQLWVVSIYFTTARFCFTTPIKRRSKKISLQTNLSTGLHKLWRFVMLNIVSTLVPETVTGDRSSLEQTHTQEQGGTFSRQICVLTVISGLLLTAIWRQYFCLTMNNDLHIPHFRYSGGLFF